MERVFYAGPRMRRQIQALLALLLITLALSFLPLSALTRMGRAPTMLGLGIIVLLLVFTIWLAAGLRGLRARPLILLDEDRLRLLPVLPLPGASGRSFRWEELEGFRIIEAKNLWGRMGTGSNRFVHLIAKNQRAWYPFVFAPYQVDGADELLALLQSRIPDLSSREIEAFLHAADGLEEVRYGPWRLAEAGPARGDSAAVPWDAVTRIRTNGMVIAGYGGLRVRHREPGGVEKEWIINPRTDDTYRLFVSYLIGRAGQAEIDPGVIEMMKAAPREARAQTATILLAISWGALMLLIRFFLDRYSLAASSPLPLILRLGLCVPIFAALPFGRQMPVSAIRRRAAFALGNLALALGIAGFFLFSPASFDLFLGDVYLGTKRPDKAVACYDEALRLYPDHVEVLYKAAQARYVLEDYERAFHLLAKAYRQDPHHWRPEALRLLPDSLERLGRHAEARRWRREIRRDYAGNARMQEAMSEPSQ